MSNFFIKILQDEKCRYEESNLREQAGIDYWHSTVLDQKQNPISGGFSESRSQARKIATSEFLERKTFREIASSSDEIRNLWGLNKIPTACGFACGFTLAGAIQRSLAEAVERWVASKWIDDDLYLKEILQSDLVPTFDPISVFLLSPFLETRFFRREVDVNFYGQTISVAVAISIGLTPLGAFVGSSAQKKDGNIWQHALLESFRHFIAIKNNPPEQLLTFPGNKVLFFSSNRQLAGDQIDRIKRDRWPDPKLSFHVHQAFGEGEYFVSRSILDGWSSWSEGPIDRFLY
jgi:hypothetical protein